MQCLGLAVAGAGDNVGMFEPELLRKAKRHRFKKQVAQRGPGQIVIDDLPGRAGVILRVHEFPCLARGSGEMPLAHPLHIFVDRVAQRTEQVAVLYRLVEEVGEQNAERLAHVRHEVDCGGGKGGVVRSGYIQAEVRQRVDKRIDKELVGIW